MSNTVKENYIPPRLTSYGTHTFDGHVTMSVVYVCEDDKNLITDSDFENGTGNWNTPSLFENGMVSIIEDSTARNGHHSLKFEAHNPFEQKLWSSFTVDVEPDTTYYFAAVVKGEQWSEDNKCDFTLGIGPAETGKFIQQSGRFTEDSQNGFAFDGNWHIVRSAFYSGTAEKISIVFCGSSFVAYVDKLYLFKEEDKVDFKFSKRDTCGGKLVNLNPQKTSCDEKDNIFKNGSFDAEDITFWKEGLGLGHTVTIENFGEDHGKAMYYHENTYGSGYPKQTYYIKWIPVEKNTNYTFSGEYYTLKNGKGWFGILNGNRYVPEPIKKYLFNSLENVWCKVGVTFNTGEYDRIGFAVCDCGGEAFIDNLYLFKV